MSTFCFTMTSNSFAIAWSLSLKPSNKDGSLHSLGKQKLKGMLMGKLVRLRLTWTKDPPSALAY